MACKDAIVFYVFLRPPDGRKNPDLSDFMNYPIRRSDCSTICHSRASVFSDSFIPHVNLRNHGNWFGNATIFGRK